SYSAILYYYASVRFIEHISFPTRRSSDLEKRVDEDWEDRYRHQPDVQQYADLALTKYYDVTDGLGLSYGFDALDAYLRTIPRVRSEEHTSELQSPYDIVCRLLLEKKKNIR